MDEKEIEEDDEESPLDPLSTSFDPLQALYSSDVVIPDPEAAPRKSFQQFLVNPHDESFDAEIALYAEDAIIPVPNAPIFDNMSKFISHLNPKPKKDVPKPGASETNPGPSTSSQPENTRRFLPHQMPVQGRGRARVERNVLTRMAAVQGPLALLYDCMERRVRVKVFTRNMKGIRGYCIALVAAFDKHWNLALEDVTEVWTRKKMAKTKVPALGTDAPEAIPELTWEGLPRPRPPRVVVRKTSKKSEECERHIDQLLVRGEQVALIAVMP